VNWLAIQVERSVNIVVESWYSFLYSGWGATSYIYRQRVAEVRLWRYGISLSSPPDNHLLGFPRKQYYWII
jgi:hypothetical protein